MTTLNSNRSVGGFFRLLTGCFLSGLILAGCGTDHPFDRGEDFDEGAPPEAVENASFQTDIKPILAKCTGCHSGGAGGWTYSGGATAYDDALSVVDTNNPEGSLILVKGSGGGGHGGGTIFSSGGAEYQTILNWILASAPDN